MDVKRRLLNVFFYMQLQVKFRLVDAIESHNLTRDGRTLPCVQYIASLALVEAVKEYTAHVQGRVGEKEVLPGLKIKWPNDLYYGNQKNRRDIVQLCIQRWCLLYNYWNRIQLA